MNLSELCKNTKCQTFLKEANFLNAIVIAK